MNSQPIIQTAQETGNYDFRQDLVGAKRTENQVADLLFKHYGTELLKISATKAYDIKVKNKAGKIVYLEIKEDFQCGKTRNVALEFESWGRPAGLSVTMADFYIYVLHERNGLEYWITSIYKLREIVDKKLYFTIVNGGDEGSNSINYLFKLSVFKKHSKQLFV